MLPLVSLNDCEYNADQRRLTLASELFGGSFPRQFFVHSPRTGKEVRFTRVEPYDVLYDEDQWDGEQQIYRPVGHVPRVEYAVVHHQS